MFVKFVNLFLFKYTLVQTTSTGFFVPYMLF